MKQASGTAGRIHVLRLLPGADVRTSIRDWANENTIEAAVIASAVGSLTRAHLRYAGRADGIMTTADLEVLSFSGTLSRHGMHVHLSVADRDGQVLGGHLLEGCTVRTTLELIIHAIDGVSMLRMKDEATGYDELDPVGR
jgi:uncharacterized protein